jgi:hypothetical protein
MAPHAHDGSVAVDANSYDLVSGNSAGERGSADETVTPPEHVFRRQLATPTRRVPAFLFRPDVPYFGPRVLLLRRRGGRAALLPQLALLAGAAVARRLTVSTELAEAIDAVRVA